MHLRPFLLFAAAALGLTTGVRLILSLWLSERISSSEQWWGVLYWGLRIDLQTIGIVGVLFALWSLASGLLPSKRVWAFGSRMMLGLVFLVMLIMEVTTPTFIVQYDLRPNRLFFEYLDRPAEVLGTLLHGFLGPTMLALAATGLIFTLFWRALHLSLQHTSAGNHRQWLIVPALLILSFGAARGTVAHRPLNPANASLASDALINDLALNSLYSVGYAVYSLRHENHLVSAYGKIPPAEMLQIVRETMAVAPEAFVSDKGTQHRNVASGSGRPNVVIILEESLGAEFVGALGGADLTPNLDSLANEGWWFDRLYATGTRSVRGIEAVITGFPPSPSRAVVKLDGAQNDFYTLAHTFNNAGYHSQFVYGGDANFDNMRRFLANNGFQEVIEHKDFEAFEFEGVWGVSDEDLLNRVHQELQTPDAKPRFIFAFTSSNHEPFEFPEGRIGVGTETHGVNDAVLYTDWALGEFVEKAKAAAYWQNTIFLVVADHNSRVYGSQLVPIRRFQIPGVFVGGPVPVQRTRGIVSQLDLAPTLLSLAGISAIHPMIGHDLTSTPNPGRAQMQFHHIQAYMEDDQVVVLQPHLPPSHWHFDGQGLIPSSTVEALERKALAHAAIAPYLYQNRLYSAWDPDAPSSH